MLTIHIDTLVAIQREHHHDLLHEAELQRLIAAQQGAGARREHNVTDPEAAGTPGLWQRVWAAATHMGARA